MGPSGFEPEFMAPKATRMGQATPRTRFQLITGIKISYLKTWDGKGKNRIKKYAK